MAYNIFQSLLRGKWAKVNLNEEARNAAVDFTNPNEFQNWLNMLHRKKGVAYSYGGFLEDKSNVWANHYQKETGAFIHLGCDYNVPPRTFVSLFDDGTVEDVFPDTDQRGGWGGRIMWRMNSGVYVVYGHLSKSMKVVPGQKHKKGDIVGVVGEPEENGGWYTHLHVQIMKPEFAREFADFRFIDGYAPKGSKLVSMVIDPEKFIKVG